MLDRSLSSCRVQVEQERAQAGLVDHARHVAVARAVPAAAAATGEDDQQADRPGAWPAIASWAGGSSNGTGADLTGQHHHRPGSTFQTADHLTVVRLGEVRVELADGKERPRGSHADQLVRITANPRLPPRRGHRDGQHHPGCAVRPRHLAGGARRRTRWRSRRPPPPRHGHRAAGGASPTGTTMPGVPVPLENWIWQVTCRSSGRQAACVYSLIRPLRTGFRRICRVPTSVTVAG